MSEVQTDVGALITWAEEEARLNRKVLDGTAISGRIPGCEREYAAMAEYAEKLEAIATELRKLEP